MPPYASCPLNLPSILPFVVCIAGQFNLLSSHAVKSVLMAILTGCFVLYCPSLPSSSSSSSASPSPPLWLLRLLHFLRLLVRVSECYIDARVCCAAYLIGNLLHTLRLPVARPAFRRLLCLCSCLFSVMSPNLTSILYSSEHYRRRRRGGETAITFRATIIRSVI